MTLIALQDTREAGTSAAGSIHGVDLEAARAVLLLTSFLSGPVTANTYGLGGLGSMAMSAKIALCAERTATGPIGRIGELSAESAAEAILEIRRRSGLTWEELGDLFEVSRRSVHHWANGKPMSARHDRVIRRMLSAVRHLDRGDRERNRAVLLNIDKGMGVSKFDLLREGRFAEAMGGADSVPELELQRIPLSSIARDVRQPQAPVVLLEAEQDRPEIPAKARAVRPKRTSKRTG